MPNVNEIFQQFKNPEQTLKAQPSEFTLYKLGEVMSKKDWRDWRRVEQEDIITGQTQLFLRKYARQVTEYEISPDELSALRHLQAASTLDEAAYHVIQNELRGRNAALKEQA